MSEPASEPTGTGFDEAVDRLTPLDAGAGAEAAALQDRLAGGDATSEALWRAHQERMRRAVRRLRVGLPRPDLSLIHI